MLLNAAINVYARKGLDAAVAEDFISEANVSRGTFYNYFNTKEDVLNEVAKKIADDINEKVLVDTSVSALGIKRMATTVGRFIVFAEQNPTLAKVLLLVMNNISPRPVGTLTSQYMLEDLNAGREQGHINEFDDQIAANVVIGITIQAMWSTITSTTSQNYASNIAKRILISLGVENEVAETTSLLALTE